MFELSVKLGPKTKIIHLVFGIQLIFQKNVVINCTAQYVGKKHTKFVIERLLK